jgi:hypothetical protein
MRMPAISGLIERRILLNYRVDADALAGLLPAPFKPQLIDGQGVAGVCLIRLRHVRPSTLPAWLGLRSENAAHRIAVEWNDHGQLRRGVYVPRRDTNSLATVLAGGRLFPGVHHRSQFRVVESEDRYRIRVDSIDRQTAISVDARIDARGFESSIFSSLDEASDFFLAGACGYSPTRMAGQYEGLELSCDEWRMIPLRVAEVRSSFFDDRARFPPGTAEFDCGLLMRNVPHHWRQLKTLHGSKSAQLENEPACVG